MSFLSSVVKLIIASVGLPGLGLVVVPLWGLTTSRTTQPDKIWQASFIYFLRDEVIV